MHPSPTRAQVYQIDDPCYDIEGGVPSIGIKIKDPMCGISISHTSGIYKWCHFNNQVMSIKNARFKPQPSTPNVNLCINKKHTFLCKLMTKGERLYKNMKALGGRDWNKEVEVGHGHGQRGSNIEEKRWIKILGQEKHTSRGSKLMNFDWLHLICA